MTSAARCVAIAWLVFAVLVPWGRAQSPPSKPTSDSGDQANTAKAQFDQLFKQFKDLLGEIRQLQLEYKRVKPAQRPPIEQAFQEKTTRAREMLARLKQLAMEAFRADPSQKEIARFLAVVALQAHRKGHLAEALRVFELLDSQGFQHPEMDAMAGEAAFNLSRYDLAEKFLTRAKKSSEKPPAQVEQMLAQLPKEKELWAQEQKLREEEAKRGDKDPKALPRVLLRTTKGDMVIELFEDQAPNTVANFIYLVEKGFYDGLTFHRVIPGFVAQGGDPQGDGSGGPGYTIPDEHNRQDARRHYWGSVAMAHTGKANSAGSQFYIAYKRLPALDGSYTVFGRVIQGMDVAVKLNPQDPQDKQKKLPPDRILSARVIRKRNHPYVPKVFLPGASEPKPLGMGTSTEKADEAPPKKKEPQKEKKEGTDKQKESKSDQKPAAPKASLPEPSPSEKKDASDKPPAGKGTTDSGKTSPQPVPGGKSSP